MLWVIDHALYMESKEEQKKFLDYTAQPGLFKKSFLFARTLLAWSLGKNRLLKVKFTPLLLLLLLLDHASSHF